MKTSKGINPVLRAVGVFSAVAVIAGGVTYAAMNDVAALGNNTVDSADAALQISNGGAFAENVNGFNFNNLVPDSFTSEQKFYLKNNGETALKITAMVPHAPSTTTDFGFTGWNNLEVKIVSKDPTCDTASRTLDTNMQLLMDGQVELPCGTLKAGEAGSGDAVDNAGDYTIAFRIANAHVTGNDINIDDIDFNFTGTVAN
jgi:hypothetical protein